MEPVNGLVEQSQNNPAAPAGQGGRDASFMGHAKVIGGLTLVSRVFGMLRETAVVSFLGTGMVASAFEVAFTLPNLFRKLFGEGALSAAFIPLYSKAIKEQTPQDAKDFASASTNLLTLILVGIVLIGEGVIAYLIARSGSADERYTLMLKLSAMMLPYVVLICLTAFLSGVLQVHRRFAASAAAPILLNLIHIGVTVCGGLMLGILAAKGDEALVVARQKTLAWWLAGGVLVAGGAQIALLLPSLRAVGYRFSLKLWTPGVKRMLKLSVPVAMAAGVLQVSVAMDKGISWALAEGASGAAQFSLWGWTLSYPMEMGAVVRLAKAQTLYQLPLGIFAIALATAIFPGLSQAALDADQKAFGRTLRKGIEATLFEGIAASVGLIIVRYQVIRVILHHGVVSDHDVDLMARSLMLYASGIWAYSMQQIVNRAYYALHDTRTPFWWSVWNIGINLVVELPLLWTPLRESGMAAGTAVSFAVQSVVMLWVLHRRIGGMGFGAMARSAGKMALAAGLMFALCQGVMHLPFYPAGTRFWVSAGQLGILVIVGAVTYIVACHLLGVGMLMEVLPARIRSRLAGKSGQK